jgi:lipopolysaccharide transport system ATP-binding protein
MNDYQTLICVDSASKKFCRKLKKSLWYGMQDILSEVTGRQRSHDLRPDEFWALKDVSFGLRRGECLGVIGPNGSGKSTLLKMINGLLRPDRGRIVVRGRVGALIELGTGFNPILTGRENIYNNAAVLGMTKAAVDKKLDEIIDFAEIGDFIDTAVQSYSSGMKVRLGFAVAAHLDPDVLLIDEVLAVGDVGFRAKCYNYLAGFLKNCAVILVSHSMPHIDRYCQKAMLMVNGQAVCHDITNKVIKEYYGVFKSEKSTVVEYDKNKLHFFSTLDRDNRPITAIQHGALLRIIIKATLDGDVIFPVMHLSFLNRELQIVAISKSPPRVIRNVYTGVTEIQADIEPFILNTGAYKISLLVLDEKEHRHLLWYNAAWDIEVVGDMLNYGSAGIYFDATWKQSA